MPRGSYLSGSPFAGWASENCKSRKRGACVRPGDRYQASDSAWPTQGDTDNHSSAQSSAGVFCTLPSIASPMPPELEINRKDQ